MKIRHPEKVNKPVNPIKRKPHWIKSKIINSKEFFITKSVINQNNLVTVCQEANCPNITECWSKRHATFMIMGDTCTRACGFCDVKTGKPCGRQKGEKRGYPACRPSKRVSSKTPKTTGEMSSAEKARFKREKTSSKKINYQHRRKKKKK